MLNPTTKSWLDSILTRVREGRERSFEERERPELLTCHHQRANNAYSLSLVWTWPKSRPRYRITPRSIPWIIPKNRFLCGGWWEKRVASLLFWRWDPNAFSRYDNTMIKRSLSLFLTTQSFLFHIELIITTFHWFIGYTLSRFSLITFAMLGAAFLSKRRARHLCRSYPQHVHQNWKVEQRKKKKISYTRV